MKKSILVIWVLLIFHSVQGQDFSIGPKVGLSKSNISVYNTGFESGESKTGYHLGFFVRMGGNFFYVQPEFLFTNTGGELDQPHLSQPNQSYDVNFNRLDMPLMAGIKFFNFFRLQAGPVASILLDYELKQAGQVVQGSDYKSATIGYQAGIGVDVGNLIIDFKYENSLGDISKSVAGFPSDQRQNQLILSAGFRLF